MSGEASGAGDETREDIPLVMGPEWRRSLRRSVWAVAIAYGVLVPAAIGLQAGWFTVPAGWVQWVADWAPMMNRVLAYGHPSPAVLQAHLALGWALVPVLALSMRGVSDPFARPVSWGTGLFHAVARYVILMAVAALLIFMIWYWPNLSYSPHDPISRPLTVWADGRRWAFASTWGLMTRAPLWALSLAGVVEFVRAESAALRRLWRSGYWR